MSRSPASAFDSLRLEGGLFPGEFFNDLRELRLKGQAVTDYNLHRTLKLRDEIGRYWRMARAEWETFNDLRQRQDVNRNRHTAERFLAPLLKAVFGFDSLVATPRLQLGERQFPVTHLAFGDIRSPHVPLVLTGPDHPLDKSDPIFGDEGRRRSPQGLMQEYLNATDNALWGIVSNGLVLRILRDNPSMTRPAFIEVDLQRLFADDLYADFVALWLLLHASRFSPRDGSVANCWLEQWREQAAEQGERALGDLRDGVETALRALGAGFLAHPDNQALRAAISNGELNEHDYFQQLLRLVYRLLFLLTAEDRDILHSPDAEADVRRLYAEGYSLGWLRERARKRRFYDRHADLWQALVVTFTGLAEGQPALGLPALGGLFATDQCPTLDQAAISNRALLEAIRAITWVQRKAGATRINYRDMDTEELGSVYESLLELIPRINPAVSPWAFGFVGDEDSAGTRGNARKTTGSYYTPDSLVQELIKSALLPVIEQRLADHPANPRQALLDIKVCDPACGSGHFLLAAARKLAARLAELDAAGDQYTEQQFRHALREVVQHCIHGVDLNPMAVELCKTALWLEALEPGKPLGFLDAHIRCGNALVGVFDPAQLEQGIPDAAYKPLTGDNRDIANQAKKANRANQARLAISLRMPGDDYARIDAMPEDTVEQVAAKQAAWQQIQQSDQSRRVRLLEDLYTAAFFVPKDAEHSEHIPTNASLIAAHQGDLQADMAATVQQLAEQHRFFHWRLAFPQVFDRPQGGFDVILGNPPWDVSQFSDREFFASREPSIAVLEGNDRKLAIQELEQHNPRLWQKYQLALYGVQATNGFFRGSGRFELTARGKLNLYALFAELFLNGIGERGRAGKVTPTGIATDDGTKEFFGFLSKEKKLISLFDFENREKAFPAIDSRIKFCLLTMGKNDSEVELLCFATRVSHLQNSDRRFTLTAEDFALINPNTRTCPVFRSKKDAELTAKIYRRAPVLIREAEGEQPEQNPWGIRFSQGLFNMTSASDLFEKYMDLEAAGGQLEGNHLVVDGVRYMPLYEAKMVHHYDHRWATYTKDGQICREMTVEEKNDPTSFPLAKHWVDQWHVVLRTTDAPDAVLKPWRKEELEQVLPALRQWALGAARQHGHKQTGKLAELSGAASPADNDLFAADPCAAADEMQQQSPLTVEQLERLIEPMLAEEGEALLSAGREVLAERCPKYLLGWRDITNSTNERTVIATTIPFSAVGNVYPLIIFTEKLDPTLKLALQANLTAIVFDFVARHKTGGTHLNYFIFKQLPLLSPKQYGSQDLEFIRRRVLELVYTSEDMRPFAEDLGYTGGPFPFDPARRHQLKSELDALYAHLYGLTRDELRYILDPAEVMGEDYPSETFRGLKKNELRDFGEYRTQRLVLEAYDALANERSAETPDEDTQAAPLREVAAGEWAAPPADNPKIRAMQVLMSVLRIWGSVAPAKQVQLAAVLVEKPRLVTAQLGAGRERWLRAVGEQAQPIDQHALNQLPRPDYAWGAAFREMVARGWLIEEGDRWRLGEAAPDKSLPQWALGRAAVVRELIESRDAALGAELSEVIREEWRESAA